MIVTATSILKIDVPEKLFSGPDSVHAEYKKYAKMFHPDLNRDDTGAEDAFKHLNELHAEALKKIAKNEWNIPGRFDFHRKNGNLCHFNFVKDFSNGMCKAYVGKGTLTAYVFAYDLKDLVDNAVRIIKGLTKFPNDKLKESLTPTIPKIKEIIETNDNRIVLILERPAGMIRLRDAYEYLHGKFNPKHVAWIMSRCYNFACYMEWLGYAHNDISMDTIYINPENHTICVIGGWWFSTKIGERMARLQSTRTVTYMPMDIKKSKITNISTDLELIRLLGRELLDDPTGVFLSKNKDIPPNLVNWLRMITHGKAKKDYDKWDETLVKAFGPKKFTKFELKPEQVY